MKHFECDYLEGAHPEILDENHTVVRFATSWVANEDDVDELRKIL